MYLCPKLVPMYTALICTCSHLTAQKTPACAPQIRSSGPPFNGRPGTGSDGNVAASTSFAISASSGTSLVEAALLPLLAIPGLTSHPGSEILVCGVHAGLYCVLRWEFIEQAFPNLYLLRGHGSVVSA